MNGRVEGRGGRAERREARRVRCAARREARARERAALRRLPRGERLGAWWRTRPLGVTFTAYLTVYLAVSTLLSLGLIEVFSTWNNGYYQIEVTLEDGRTQRGSVDSGPYIYDPNSRRLLPASELDLPGESPMAVFIATGEWGTGSDYVPDGGRTISTLYATVDMVRSGQVQLYDWGLNYNDWYPQEEILEVNNSISAENLARYDALSRARRAQSVELFGAMTGADLEETFGEGLVSNTAYYAASQRPAGLMPWILALATGLAPVVVYGGLGWVAFRRFYRVHIAAPLGELAGAADRIAAQDLDFSIGAVRGRELGRLSATLEHMRSSLLEAQRELWRTAESRRRLNAAFAHDLRTPITVLKGTVEMAQMRLRRGERLDLEALDALSAQVERLERYASSMGGLTKLEDRPVECEVTRVDELLVELRCHAERVVVASGGGLRFEWGESRVDAGELAREVLLDTALVEEVLDNLLNNACAHATSFVSLAVSLREGVLALAVTDDGPGFTPEALHRGCDPFFSENKSAEHFGLGLNVSSVLCGLHGGLIALENEPGLGARVIATFDLATGTDGVED